MPVSEVSTLHVVPPWIVNEMHLADSAGQLWDTVLLLGGGPCGIFIHLLRWAKPQDLASKDPGKISVDGELDRRRMPRVTRLAAHVARKGCSGSFMRAARNSRPMESLQVDFSQGVWLRLNGRPADCVAQAPDAVYRLVDHTGELGPVTG